jgi:hypothetical protein
MRLRVVYKLVSLISEFMVTVVVSSLMLAVVLHWTRSFIASYLN